MRKLLALTAISAAALAASSPASAALVLFNITGPDAISFTVDQSPTPLISTGQSFLLFPVSVTVNGIPADNPVSFFDSIAGGGLSTSGFSFLGAQLYSGSTSAPMFTIGTYPLNLQVGGAAYSLSISEVQSGVPEPATWGMMLLGFGAVGYAMRRRKQTELTFRRAA
jgi:hypothetical protein